MSGAKKVALAGINGYGAFYLNFLLDQGLESGAELVGVVDPTAEMSPRYGEIQALKIPVYDEITELFDNQEVDLLVIAAPIQYHLPMTRAGVENGAVVLCEKPLCGSIDDAQAFLELERDRDGLIAIGYQWSYSEAIQRLKQDILTGKLGRPIRLKTMTLWPRKKSYYARNNWAGRIRTDSGEVVLDSPVNNATAHYLHNMFYLLGEDTRQSAEPRLIDAWLSRANDIENYDSAASHFKVNNGTDVYFYTTHSVKERKGPVLEFEFEYASVHFSDDQNELVAVLDDGTKVNYGVPGADAYRKLKACLGAIEGRQEIVCGVSAAAAHTYAVNAIQENCEIHPFAPELIQKEKFEDGDELIWVDGLADTFESAYDRWDIPRL